MPFKFEDFEVERYVVAACLKGPDYWKVFPEVWLRDDNCRKAYKAMKDYFATEGSFPTPDTILSKIENPELRLFIAELSVVPINPLEVKPYLKQIYQMYAGRKLVEDADNLPKELITIADVDKIVRKKVSNLISLVNPLDSGITARRFIYESAAERMKTYRYKESHPNDRSAISYGIAEMDRLTNGGHLRGEMLLFFGGSGGYKTKTMANLAYNFAVKSLVDTMVISLEEPLEKYEQIFDSRHGMLDLDAIRNGTLGVESVYYRERLIDVVNKKYPLYVVDIPGGSTTADVISELERYNAIYGHYPVMLLIDYLNQMDPSGKFEGTSDKYKVSTEELRRISRSYNIGTITAMQLNRKGKELKNQEQIGTEHISESDRVQDPFATIINLWQKIGVDDVANVLNFSFKKNRNGQNFKTFSVFCNPAVNFIGDRTI
jgi:replicative DNA helicase